MENRIFIDDDFIQKCYTDFIASQIEDKLKLCDFSQPITFNNFLNSSTFKLFNLFSVA